MSPGDSPPPARRAHVVGLGLIGGSVASGLRKAGWQVTGEDADPTRAERALELGLVESLGSGRDTGLAVVATPVATIASEARRLLDEGDEDLVVTDVGGVKAGVVSAVDHARFVGGHPMAGSEQVGPEGADADLFAGASWVLTPTEATDPDAYQAVRGFVGVLGAEAIALAPERHDALVAVVSHVPHLAAATLMDLAAQAGEEHQVLLRLAAGGFRDMTRVAAGDPAIWPDIFRDNASAVLEALDALLSRLGVARSLVAAGDWTALAELLGRAQAARRNLPVRVARPESLVACRVPVPDRPGVLAEVTTVLGEAGVNIYDLEIAHSSEGERGVLLLAVDAGDANLSREALTARGYHPVLGPMS